MLDALHSNRLNLVFQTITISNPQGVGGRSPYSEALLRYVDQQAVHSCAHAIRALERLGWIDHLDLSVIWTVVELLEQYPGQRLSCNVSALFLREYWWWQPLLTYFEKHRNVARRLMIEITETSAITHIDETLELICLIREYGVRIAINDVGAGHSTFEFLSRCRPDVVKIDRSVLLRACAPSVSPNLLRNLVRVCNDYSPCIVVVGVETPQEMVVARKAGAHGFQGFLIDQPVPMPSWLTSTNPSWCTVRRPTQKSTWMKDALCLNVFKMQ